MSEKLRPALWFATLLVIGLVWLNYCHDPQVRATEKLREQTQQTDSSSQLTDSRVARLAADSFQREAQLARLDTRLRGARGEIARLQRVTLSITDSTPRELLITQLATKDSIIAAQDTALAAADSGLTIWKALAQERGQLLQRALGERDQYKAQLWAWQRIAQPGLLTKIARVAPWIAGGLVLGRVLRSGPPRDRRSWGIVGPKNAIPKHFP